MKRKTARPTSGATTKSNNGMITVSSMMIMSKRNIGTNRKSLQFSYLLTITAAPGMARH
jgi:hypothetical protein